MTSQFKKVLTQCRRMPIHYTTALGSVDLPHAPIGAVRVRPIAPDCAIITNQGISLFLASKLTNSSTLPTLDNVDIFSASAMDSVWVTRDFSIFEAPTAGRASPGAIRREDKLFVTGGTPANFVSQLRPRYFDRRWRQSEWLCAVPYGFSSGAGVFTVPTTARGTLSKWALCLGRPSQQLARSGLICQVNPWRFHDGHTLKGALPPPRCGHCPADRNLIPPRQAASAYCTWPRKQWYTPLHPALLHKFRLGADSLLMVLFFSACLSLTLLFVLCIMISSPNFDKLRVHHLQRKYNL